jgi:hypothetical protein
MAKVKKHGIRRDSKTKKTLQSELSTLNLPVHGSKKCLNQRLELVKLPKNSLINMLPQNVILAAYSQATKADIIAAIQDPTKAATYVSKQNVLSARWIRNHTRPCPNCFASIEKQGGIVSI